MARAKKKAGSVTIKTRVDKETGRTIVSAKATGDVDLRDVIGGVPPPKTYWAMLLKYEPFVMGGDVWQPARYETEGKPVKIGKYRCFSFFNEITEDFHVHEIKTGGLLGHGKTLAKAVRLAEKNIDTTPDLDEQMKKAGDVMNVGKIITREWALKCGSKGR